MIPKPFFSTTRISYGMRCSASDFFGLAVCSGWVLPFRTSDFRDWFHHLKLRIINKLLVIVFSEVRWLQCFFSEYPDFFIEVVFSKKTRWKQTQDFWSNDFISPLVNYFTAFYIFRFMNHKKASWIFTPRTEKMSAKNDAKENSYLNIPLLGYVGL